MSESVKIDPLVHVTGIREHDFSVYPDILRVPMEDGRVINYYREIEQPAPILGKWLEQYDKTCQIGYGRKKKRRTNRDVR